MMVQAAWVGRSAARSGSVCHVLPPERTSVGDAATSLTSMRARLGLDTVADSSPSGTLESEADLRAVYKKPSPPAIAKDIGRIDEHCRRFIELSPFLCIGTMNRDGFGDVSPRGGEPGFVHVLDDKHLAIPDRPGNNRLDTLKNLVEQPGAGLMFLIPGIEDIVRINGTARVSRDPKLMARFIVEGKPPLSVLVIEVREAFLHCGKAIRRARLWDPAARVDRSSYPSAGHVLRDQLSLEVEPTVIDAALESSARKTLY
jgi:uncharacterized protein